MDMTSTQQISDQAVVFLVFSSNEDCSSVIDTDSNTSTVALMMTRLEPKVHTMTETSKFLHIISS